jgi:cell fate (sporulation/competence/biofilm development) regulator YmcA (YheA/YmcA/DUF963 family)
MVRNIGIAAAQFDETTLKLIDVYSSTVKKIADAVTSSIEAISEVAAMDIPKNFDKFLGLNFLILFMVRGMASAALQFDAATLKLVGVYADTAKKILNTVVDVGDAFKAIDNLPLTNNLKKKYISANDMILFMISTMRDSALGFDQSTLKLIQVYASTIKEVLDAMIDVDKAFSAVDNMPFTNNFKDKFIGINKLVLFMVDTLRELIIPVYDVGLEIGNAIIRGIEDAISEGLNPTVGRPGFPQLATPNSAPDGTGRQGAGIENVNFYTTINNDMDAEEFQQRTLETIRGLTE